ncbi:MULTISPECIES: MFS transporter [Sphingomonadaceae]|uniref:Putative NreB protein n=1 Tax=Novosphingobium pentaromativorans US6-1 TaxID=1088721 RepID=G6EJN1_9SPHN|nr:MULTISPECIES: MFS transporter [Sphingomonadaceae]AIT82346.1 major facilitator transporter [Novosphingobium pentaromativorans US6-1]EHJ58500.1 putative NreB protein [Novosphingobium pentaromativorans US6-1]KKC27538.1 major facilitator transporter [Sphingomonas sp. SRS2]ODU35483.1 MAG: MFS transporter [Sphingopyxis sp. SCN 67-31]
MLSVLANRTYRQLFLAQVIALVGTGLATVALGLLAYDIAGADAGAVLGTAMAIKMIAYIGVAPIVGAYANRLPRRAFLIAMDVIRCLVALALPFVDQVWQIYILIFVLQSASAGFTPTFQATIPDVLPEEKDYTRALSLSRLAYDMESLTSPMLAAALLTVMNFHWLFSGTAIGFACSALLVLTTTLPRSSAHNSGGGIYDNTTRGARLYLKTPRLRGLLAVTLAAAAASAMVIVNTPVLVQAALGLGQREVAITLAAFGGGSMLAALLLPRLLERLSDRKVMLSAASVMTVALAVLALTWRGHASPGYWGVILAGWLVLGIAYSASITPGGRLLRRSSAEEDRPALFAAQFALSHVCWLIAYPLAGQVGALEGMGIAFGATAALALIGTVIAFGIWPKEDVEVVAHRHDDLPLDHPHLLEGHPGGRAGHAFVIDELHPRWPIR